MLRRKLIVATEAYRKAFKAPAAEVRLQARPRLAINSVDDLKTLADGGVLTIDDMRRIRRQVSLDI